MTLSVSSLSLFAEALVELQIDWHALLKACELDPELLADPDARISQAAFERICMAAQEASSDRCIGLHAGEVVHAHAVNLFGYLMLSSSTLDTGIRRIARYQQVLAEVPWIEVSEGSDPARLRVGAAAGDDDFRAIHAEYVAATVLRILDWVSDAEVRPESVSFRHDARGPRTDYARVLRCDVTFGADRNELVLSAATLARPSRHAEESLARLHEDLAGRLLSSRGEAEFSDQVRRALAERLELGVADLSSVARQLGMSARSLQRRLSDEGASFSTGCAASWPGSTWSGARRRSLVSPTSQDSRTSVHSPVP
jgi:AraC-like DNA-binding protein